MSAAPSPTPWAVTADEAAPSTGLVAVWVSTPLAGTPIEGPSLALVAWRFPGPTRI